MILAIDIGNSCVHFGCFNGTGRMVASEILSHGDLKRLISRNGARIKCLPKPQSAVRLAVFASTCPRMDNPVKRFVKRLFGIKALQAGKDFKVPINNRTGQPAKVGQDRLLNALAAYRHTRKRTIVIDAGTAITIDAVSAEVGLICFLGGVIVPGMTTMAKALNQNCALLPLIKPHKAGSVIGKNTADAINSGIYWGVVGMVNQIVNQMARTLKARPAVVLTGGGAELIKPHLDFKYRHFPHLTLEGLYLCAKHIRQIPHLWQQILTDN